jgi:MaoC like domain
MIKTITNTQTVERMNSHTDRRSQPGSFDPVGFTVVPPRKFEDLRVGDVFRAPSRTLTDAHASAFQTVSADNHPIHYDVEYARRHGHNAPVVHGLQVLALTAPGGHPVSAIHRRRVYRIYECLVSIPEGGACGRHALSPTRNHQADDAGRHGYRNHASDGA